MTSDPSHSTSTTRRAFLKQSGAAAAAAALTGAIAYPRPGYCAEANAIQVALVGCGGRGTGAAANALSTEGPVQLCAMADVFEHRLKGSLNALSTKFPDRVAVPAERQFLGFDAFERAMETLRPGDLVILATPPAFRPIHLERAVERGVHVFMEKSFAVDAPGIRRVLQAGEAAKQKNLKIAGGLMSRHYPPLEEAIARIHDGAIGDLITCWAYRMHGPVGLSERPPGREELAHQIANYSCFTWLNGSFIVDWLIHNIDVCCWAKNSWPVSVQGMGGRIVREVNDQLYDHYAAEYSFEDGTRLMAEGRHMARCHAFFGDILHGATGSAVLGEGQPNPKLYRGHAARPENALWLYSGPACDAYQREFDLLLEAIRSDRPYNETERCAKSCLTAIMGRMACESGRMITVEEALASDLSLAPHLDQIASLDAPPPVQSGPDGAYPIAKPGLTVAL